MTQSVTLLQLLADVNAYPIPPRTLIGIGAGRGLDIDVAATPTSVASDAFRLAKADVLMWLAGAPNITQGGQSYSFSDDQRSKFRCEAQSVYNELGEVQPATIYGYKGSRL